MTDSASAGTAFACGVKTRSSQIGVSSDLTKRYKSVAQLARESGKKVGIITSVSLDHATPASYYASVPNRGLMNNIASQMAATGYEFFGGGGLVAPTGPARGGDTANNVWELLAANGYTVLNDRPSIEALKTQPKDRVVCINPWLQDAAAMPYDIDRPDTNLSLREMVEVAVACLLWKLFLPLLLRGYSPVPVGLAIVGLLTAVICLTVGGLTRKGWATFAGSMLGLLLTCALSVGFTRLFRLHGAIRPFSEMLLAYSGSHIMMFMVFLAKGLPAANLLNAPFVAAEVLNILVGSFGLVTVAPFTALVAAGLFRRPRRSAE